MIKIFLPGELIRNLLTAKTIKTHAPTFRGTTFVLKNQVHLIPLSVCRFALLVHRKAVRRFCAQGDVKGGAATVRADHANIPPHFV